MLAKQDFIDQIWSSSRRRRRPRHAGQSKIHCPNLKQQKKKKKKAPTCWPIQNSLPKFETEEEEEEGPDMLANQKFIDQIWSSKRRRRRPRQAGQSIFHSSNWKRRRFELLFWLKKNIRYALKKDWMQTDARNKKKQESIFLAKEFYVVQWEAGGGSVSAPHARKKGTCVCDWIIWISYWFPAI